jgi:Coenzyme PQQ synthesis protein D (PqqD)
MADNADRERVTLDVTLIPQRAAVDDLLSDGECLVYNSSRDEASALNRSATEIWQLCDGSLSVGSIAHVLGQRYGVDRDLLLEDVVWALHALRTHGLVTFATESTET